jgi:hypothetical protein
MKKPTRKDCSGCRDDFYNHNRMGLNEDSGTPECWNLKDATFVKAMDIPIDMRPPYLGMPMVTRPKCYKAPRYVRVRKEALNVKGYWR